MREANGNRATRRLSRYKKLLVAPSSSELPTADRKRDPGTRRWQAPPTRPVVKKHLSEGGMATKGEAAAVAP